MPLLLAVLPAAEFRYSASVGNSIKENEVDRKKRVGHGSNPWPLPVVRMLMKCHDNWREIITKEQYQFPGVSVNGQSSMLLYSKDVSKLPQYVVSKPHFLWDDIQLSKGKLNPDRMVTMNINGIDEEVFYRMAPCNEVKCVQHLIALMFSHLILIVFKASKFLN